MPTYENFVLSFIQSNELFVSGYSSVIRFGHNDTIQIMDDLAYDIVDIIDDDDWRIRQQHATKYTGVRDGKPR